MSAFFLLVIFAAVRTIAQGRENMVKTPRAENLFSYFLFGPFQVKK
jgi:hypothetical protein